MESAPTTSTTQFSINQWFNNLPIRIIGTPEEPFFYAQDIGDVLGIKKVSTIISKANSGYTEKDLVTPAQRQQYRLITYRKYKNEMRTDNTVLLLTERGATKLIITSRSEIAAVFQDFIFDLIHTARLTEREQLKTLQQNNIVALNSCIIKLNNELKIYQAKVPIIYIFKKDINGGDPYAHIPHNELDDYYMSFRDDLDSADTIYKITTKPSATDFSEFELYAKMYGVKSAIFSSINIDDRLNISEAASKYCIYKTDEPEVPDLEYVDIDYIKS